MDTTTTIVDPVGTEEIADMLGVQRRTVEMWRYRATRAREAPGFDGDPTGRLFPLPDVVVSRVLVWQRATIEEWAERTGKGCLSPA